jgi:diadenosine tetraphosphate (Ap4A) HIT family hydrolase
VARVAAALQAVYAPRKINYSCLGNQIAHMHWHVTPRLLTDPSPRDAIWSVAHTPVRLGPSELAERIATLQNRLGI